MQPAAPHRHRGLRILAVAASFLAACSAVPAATYYVSPRGDDGHTGLGPRDGQALRSIQSGVDRLRAGDTLVIRGGVYRETITFPTSGTADEPITVRPYRDETVVITGCEPLEGWQPHRDGIWRAPMPWTLGPGRNQVFADGQVMIEARFPNEPAPGLVMPVAGLSPLWPTFGEFSIPDPEKNPGRVVSALLDGQPDDYWKGALYYGIHYQGWSAQTGVIEGPRSGEITVGDRTQTWWFSAPYHGYQPEEGRGMIVGHMHALDRPGEWHWQDNVLYLIPPAGGRPRNVEAKRRQLALDLSGREHIRIRGLRIHAASMRLEGSAHCVVEGCDLSYLSHFTRFYSCGQIEQGRDTIKSGEVGILVSGHDNAFLNCSVRYSAGAGFNMHGYRQTVHNCLVDQVDYTSHYLYPLTIGQDEDFLNGSHVFTYNTLCNVGRSFVNFSGYSVAARSRAPSGNLACLFAHNHVFNGMLQTRDAGFVTGYYSDGGSYNDTSSQGAYNVLHDSYDIFAMRINALGIIYLDAGTCHVDLHHNLLWAAPGSLQRGLWYNTMCVGITDRDNLFHKDFRRTSATLRAEDFPEGKPFRFGHDFKHPPPLPKWPQIESRRLEAEACTAASAGVEKGPHGVAGLADGDWIAFDPVDLSAGWQSAVMSFASDDQAMNTDRSARTPPRHQKATDPLILEATVYDEAHPAVRTQWTFAWNIHNGDWIRYNQVPFGDGYRRFRAVYGNDSPDARWLEVHIDKPDGPMVARVPLAQTDEPRDTRIQVYREAVGEVAPEANGTHNVFLVFRAEDDRPVGEFHYFRFEGYRGEIALQKNEVKLEVRVGSKDGEKIGEFHPRFTGGADAFRETIAALEPVRASAPQALYLVVRSATGRPMGRIDWISLERAKEPMDMAGLGIAPLMRNGRMLLPRPTNRPLPGRAYSPPQPETADTAPRPQFVAHKLAGPPDIDGRLDEWPVTDEARTMVLDQAPDRAPAQAPPSQAWIGYNDEALYIAVKHPVANAGSLDYESHRWGATDAMEVAIQDAFAADPGPILNLYGWPDGHSTSTGQAGAPPDVVDRLGKAVTYEACIGPDCWSCEWRIPFAACGLTPKTARKLLFNLGVMKTAQYAWVIWRGALGPTYQVAKAGELLLRR